MTSAEELMTEYQAYAEKHNYQINPNNKFVEVILKGLLKNEEEKGARYCPCRRVTGDEEEDKKIICPCVFHEQEIEETGKCHCMLFMKKD